jgi:uncharacterized protein
MKVIDCIAMILLLIGGINWGLLGAFDFNIVTWLFGMVPALMKLVYILVGLSALWLLFQWKAVCKRCSSKR